MIQRRIIQFGRCHGLLASRVSIRVPRRRLQATRATRRLLTIVTLVIAATAQSALACPLCYIPKGENTPSRWPIVLVTAVMAALPLSMVLGFTRWYRRAQKQQQSRDQRPHGD
jgi:hypothetical protein